MHKMLLYYVYYPAVKIFVKVYLLLKEIAG